MTETSNLTLKELEQKIIQSIQDLYVELLGHRPQQVSCQIVDKTLTAIVEDSITQPEQVLFKSGKQELVKQVHSNLYTAVESRLRTNIEEIAGVSVTNLFADSTLNTRRTSIVAILEATPNIIEPN